MGGGLSERNTLLAQCMTALFAALAFLITGIHGITVPTAGPRWTEVLTMRLIDVDDLGVGRCSKDILPAAYCAGWNGLLGLIEKAPTVDAVVVTRCKDCKHLCVWNRKDLYAFCPKTNIVFLPFDKDTRTFFCNLGERKDGGDG